MDAGKPRARRGAARRPRLTRRPRGTGAAHLRSLRSLRLAPRRPETNAPRYNPGCAKVRVSQLLWAAVPAEAGPVPVKVRSCGVAQQPGWRRRLGTPASAGTAARRAAGGSLLTRVDGRAAAPSRRMRSVPPPACGGLCRLKPAFQAVPATLGLSIPARTFMPRGVCGRTDHEHFSRWGLQAGGATTAVGQPRGTAFSRQLAGDPELRQSPTPVRGGAGSGSGTSRARRTRGIPGCPRAWTPAWVAGTPRPRTRKARRPSAPRPR